MSSEGMYTSSFYSEYNSMLSMQQDVVMPTLSSHQSWLTQSLVCVSWLGLLQFCPNTGMLCTQSRSLYTAVISERPGVLHRLTGIWVETESVITGKHVLNIILCVWTLKSLPGICRICCDEMISIQGTQSYCQFFFNKKPPPRFAHLCLITWESDFDQTFRVIIQGKLSPRLCCIS